MTTRILKRYDINNFEFLEALIDVGFETAKQVIKREKAIQKLRNNEIKKIINILGREAKY